MACCRQLLWGLLLWSPLLCPGPSSRLPAHQYRASLACVQDKLGPDHRQAHGQAILQLLTPASAGAPGAAAAPDYAAVRSAVAAAIDAAKATNDAGEVEPSC